MTKYVAFLRGVNVGGHKPVKMEALKEAFESLGFKNVKTILASGNVLFETEQADESVITGKIEEKLKNTFDSQVGVLIREITGLQRLAGINPFKGIKVTPQTRLYVTFLSERPRSLRIPAEPFERNFQIVSVSENEVCSVLILTPSSRTTDLMGLLEKDFGKKITTRNWNTLAKILKA